MTTYYELAAQPAHLLEALVHPTAGSTRRPGESFDQWKMRLTSEAVAKYPELSGRALRYATNMHYSGLEWLPEYGDGSQEIVTDEFPRPMFDGPIGPRPIVFPRRPPVPPKPKRKRPLEAHYLYRLYSDDGHLLYIGVTNLLDARLAQHAATQLWWHEVASHEAVTYPTRGAVIRAESAAIRDELPRYNIQHAHGGSVHRLAAVLAIDDEPPGGGRE